MKTGGIGCWAGLLLGMVVLGLPPVALADDPSGSTGTPEDWTPLWTTANLSQARLGVAAMAAGGKVFFAGGFGSSSSNVVDIYDSATGAWSTTTLSVARVSPAITVVGDKLIIGGGYAGTYSSAVDIYNTTTNTWSTASLSVARANLAAASAGGKAVFGGGQKVDPNFMSPAVDIYDSVSNTWSTAQLSQGRDTLAATAVGGKVLFGGGAFGSTVVDIYDAMANTWSTAALSTGRGNLAATTWGSKAFFGGGWANGGIANVDIYDSSTNTWSTAALSQGRGYLAAASAGGKVLFGGGSVAGGIYSNVVDIYDVASGSWTTSTLSQGRNQIAAASLGNKVFFAGGAPASNGARSDRVDIYTLQNYGTITSSKAFSLVDHTTVGGRMQLSAGASLTTGTYSMSVGSMSGVAPITISSSMLSAGGDNSSSSYAGAITGAGSLVKTGTGTLNLSGTNSYSGTTAVNQGTLRVDGALLNSAISVSGGARIGGNGSIGRTLSLVGGISSSLRGTINLVDGSTNALVLNEPDASVTALAFGGVGAGEVSDLYFEVGTVADQLQITAGKLAINAGGGQINITALPGFARGVYDLIAFTPGQASGLDRLTLATTQVGTYELSLQTTASSVQLVVAPEPAACAIIAIGAAATLMTRRKRK